MKTFIHLKWYIFISYLYTFWEFYNAWKFVKTSDSSSARRASVTFLLDINRMTDHKGKDQWKLRISRAHFSWCFSFYLLTWFTSWFAVFFLSWYIHFILFSILLFLVQYWGSSIQMRMKHRNCSFRVLNMTWSKSGKRFH